MYKALKDSIAVNSAWEKGFRRIFKTGNVPDSWKGSRTVMIPKKNRPTVADLRPIAMTDISCKIMMSNVSR